MCPAKVPLPAVLASASTKARPKDFTASLFRKTVSFSFYSKLTLLIQVFLHGSTTHSNRLVAQEALIKYMLNLVGGLLTQLLAGLGVLRRS